ncbi:dehydrogenase/reductase SDR family member 13-like [Pectinophora gossypiella]|uniref:dehydrogenase/reductase SDR family member 13-like n=1 Tax=Pectinophora gossypiella TaxID=13191 RepID=UPI00214E6B26|nr:dehydrogenase/reductase SDR family member 13-like [Pectinophora gossypiella]
MWLWCVLAALLVVIYIALVKLSFGICKCSRHLVGKVTIVTGANSGVGFETAKDFADRGAKVIIACRNEERGRKARDDIITATGNKDVHCYKLDLSSLASVRDFAEKIRKEEKRLDILVNNAGDLDLEMKTTEDGLLLGMQVNYFGPFLLTNLLLPLLKTSAPSRIVNVASAAHKLGTVDIERLNDAPENWMTKMKVYGNAKLCFVLMTGELAKQLNGSGVTVNSLCPGFVDTNIMNKVKNSFWRSILKLKTRIDAKSCWEGAQTQIYLSVSPEVNEVSGEYFTDCKKRKLEHFAKDPVVAKKLWEVTEKLVNLK